MQHRIEEGRLYKRDNSSMAIFVASIDILFSGDYYLTLVYITKDGKPMEPVQTIKRPEELEDWKLIDNYTILF